MQEKSRNEKRKEGRKEGRNERERMKIGRRKGMVIEWHLRTRLIV